MTIKVCLGIWHDRIAAGLSLEDLAKVEAHLGSSTFELRLLRDRTVELVAGEYAFTNPGDRVSEGYELRIDCPRGEERVATARCANHWESMYEGDGRFHLLLEPDHRLPWPRLRDCDAYWTHEELFREIMIRRRSSLLAGDGTVTPPASISQRLTAKQRVELGQLTHSDRLQARAINPKYKGIAA